MQDPARTGAGGSIDPVGGKLHKPSIVERLKALGDRLWSAVFGASAEEYQPFEGDHHQSAAPIRTEPLQVVELLKLQRLEGSLAVARNFEGKSLWNGLLPYARARLFGHMHLEHRDSSDEAKFTASLIELIQAGTSYDDLNSLAISSPAPTAATIKKFLKGAQPSNYDSHRLRWAYGRYLNNNSNAAMPQEKERSSAPRSIPSPHSREVEPPPAFKPALSNTVELPPESHESTILAIIQRLEDKLRRPQPTPGCAIHSGQELEYASINDTREYCLVWLKETALHRDTGIRVLHRLAASPLAEVRAAVAANEGVPYDLLEKLCKDERAAVRCAVAQSARASKEVLEQLARDANSFVALRARETLRRRESHRRIA